MPRGDPNKSSVAKAAGPDHREMEQLMALPAQWGLEAGFLGIDGHLGPWTQALLQESVKRMFGDFESERDRLMSEIESAERAWDQAQDVITEHRARYGAGSNGERSSWLRQFRSWIWQTRDHRSATTISRREAPVLRELRLSLANAQRTRRAANSWREMAANGLRANFEYQQQRAAIARERKRNTTMTTTTRNSSLHVERVEMPAAYNLLSGVKLPLRDEARESFLAILDAECGQLLRAATEQGYSSMRTAEVEAELATSRLQAGRAALDHTKTAADAGDRRGSWLKILTWTPCAAACFAAEFVLSWNGLCFVLNVEKWTVLGVLLGLAPPSGLAVQEVVIARLFEDPWQELGAALRLHGVQSCESPWPCCWWPLLPGTALRFGTWRKPAKWRSSLNPF